MKLINSIASQKNNSLMVAAEQLPRIQLLFHINETTYLVIISYQLIDHVSV